MSQKENEGSASSALDAGTGAAATNTAPGGSQAAPTKSSKPTTKAKAAETETVALNPTTKIKVSKETARKYNVPRENALPKLIG